MCIVLNILRSAKFGVVVFKAPMLDCKGGQSAMSICTLFYMYRPAKFGVAVFRASMLDWPGGQSAMGICALFYMYIDLPSLV